MTRENKIKLKQARREEELLKDALEFNYFSRERRTKAFKALKKVQLYILKLYLEDENDEQR
jgi:hypothetical protein